MKKNSSSIKARVLAGVPFLLTGIILLALSATYGAKNKTKSRAGANAPQSVISPSLAVPTLFSGAGYDQHVFPCSTPLNGPFPVLAGRARIVVQVSATLANNDLTATLLFGPTAGTAVAVAGPEDGGTSSELLLYQPGGLVPPGNYWVQICETPNPGAVPQTAPFSYNGTFTTEDTAPAGGTPPPKTLSVAPAPLDNGAKIGFENFAAPGVFVKGKTTEGRHRP